MASKKRTKVRLKKRCCRSRRLCAGCPMRPENLRKRS